jgi:hypothetical protein
VSIFQTEVVALINISIKRNARVSTTLASSSSTTATTTAAIIGTRVDSRRENYFIQGRGEA